MDKIIFIIIIYTIFIQASIDDEIDKIQNAPIEERFKLMNKLKEEIAKMQEERRMESIEKLKIATDGELITVDKNSTESRDKKHIKNILIEHININIKEIRGGDND